MFYNIFLDLGQFLWEKVQELIFGCNKSDILAEDNCLDSAGDITTAPPYSNTEGISTFRSRPF